MRPIAQKVITKWKRLRVFHIAYQHGSVMKKAQKKHAEILSQKSVKSLTYSRQTV